MKKILFALFATMLFMACCTNIRTEEAEPSTEIIDSTTVETVEVDTTAVDSI